MFTQPINRFVVELEWWYGLVNETRSRISITTERIVDVSVQRILFHRKLARYLCMCFYAHVRVYLRILLHIFINLNYLYFTRHSLVENESFSQTFLED